MNLKEYTVDSINHLSGELGIEFEIVLTDGGGLNFYKSFLYLNVWKKIYMQNLL